ncbi:MAG: histidine phosphatase family protein [Pseudomonadota bacterium]
MFRRLFVLMFAALAATAAAAAGAASEEAFWSTLKSGGHVVLIRHAVTDPGIGDPPGFTIGNCSTQRNLSAKGRADAKRLGEAFRSRNIPIADVLSSRWCRCIDTAQLAFGRVTPAPMLDSMFRDGEGAGGEKVREVLAAAGRRTGSGNLILVTHAQNIQALAGVSPSSGEMVVVTLDGAGKFKVVGRLEVPGG